jgi:hypothetical protein
VLALLQQEQRVAYRVLKRRLQLDDETLEDLKDDLIYAKKLAVDEDGRVLVWTGGTSGAPALEIYPRSVGCRWQDLLREAGEDLIRPFM